MVGELLRVIRSRAAGRRRRRSSRSSTSPSARTASRPRSTATSSGRHRGRQIGPRTTNQKQLRRRHPRQHDHLRHRPGRHRQDLPGGGRRGRGLLRPSAWGASSSRGRRSRRGRASGFLPGTVSEKVDPYFRPLFDALYDMMSGDKLAALDREGRDRDRAARLHARAHAERLVHHPGRGAEHDARADEDVPDAARLRLADGRHRRRHADRPAARPPVGPGPRARGARRDPRHLVRALRQPRRRAPQAGAAHRGRLQGLRRAQRDSRAASPRRRAGERARASRSSTARAWRVDSEAVARLVARRARAARA